MFCDTDTTSPMSSDGVHASKLCPTCVDPFFFCFRADCKWCVETVRHFRVAHCKLYYAIFRSPIVTCIYTSFISLDPWRFLSWLEIFGSQDGTRRNFYKYYSGWITPQVLCHQAFCSFLALRRLRFEVLSNLQGLQLLAGIPAISDHLWFQMDAWWVRTCDLWEGLAVPRVSFTSSI